MKGFLREPAGVPLCLQSEEPLKVPQTFFLSAPYLSQCKELTDSGLDFPIVTIVFDFSSSDPASSHVPE